MAQALLVYREGSAVYREKQGGTALLLLCTCRGQVLCLAHSKTPHELQLKQSKVFFQGQGYFPRSADPFSPQLSPTPEKKRGAKNLCLGLHSAIPRLGI